MKKISHAWKPGDIVRIPLQDGFSGFGRVLQRPLMAFYNLKSKESPALEQILSAPTIFKVWVMTSIITKGEWPVIGSKPLSPDLEEQPEFFKIDPISRKLSIYLGNGLERPATVIECEKLESAAVWSANHLVDRLNDYFDGIPNKWVESMKPK